MTSTTASSVSERRPPSLVKELEVAVLDGIPTVSSTRFVVDNQQQPSARTATDLTTRPGQILVPVTADKIRFINATTDDFHDDYSIVEPPEYRDSTTRPGPLQSRPPKRRRVSKNSESLGRPGKIILRTSRPLKIAKDVHLDAWRLIFCSSDLRFLLDAKLVCRDFYMLLQDQSIWKQSRENQFGTEMPEPPGNLTEQQYADLLVGKGCQNRRCAKWSTAKVYWAFEARLCNDCLSQKTIRVGQRGLIQGRLSFHWIFLMPLSQHRTY